MKVEITCKDSLIEKYCQETFGPRFQKALDRIRIAGSKEGLLRRFTNELTKEATRQEWYDYVEIPGMVPGTTRRMPLMEGDEPKLLVPEVRIT